MNSLTIETITSRKQRRIYYIDWLRMLAVLGVFYIHSGNMFGLLYGHMQSRENNSGAAYFANFFPQWGMSLFFLLSGASTWFALRTRTGKQFFSERCLRILIPFIVGVILLAPFQAYFQASSYSFSQESFLQFYPHFFASIQPRWNPQWLGTYYHHLWFLAYLFTFSVIALPLFLYLKRAAGRLFISRLATVCERRGGLYVFLFPVVLINIALRATFPGYQNWADVLCWLTFFVYGYILFANPRFECAIKQQGRTALFVGIACTLMTIASWITGFSGPWTQAPNYSAGCLFFQFLHSVNTWSWLVFLLCVASKRLNFSNNMLEYGKEATFPFYLLHFPVVVTIAFYVIPLDASIIVKFLLISTSSLLATLALSDLLLRLMNVAALLGKTKHQTRGIPAGTTAFNIPGEKAASARVSPGDICQHHDQHQMNEHGNHKTPGNDNDPFAVTQYRTSTRRTVCFRPAFGSNQPHSNAQAQGRTNRRTTHFNKERTVTGFTQCPRMPWFWHTLRLHQGNSIKPRTMCADRTAHIDSFLRSP